MNFTALVKAHEQKQLEEAEARANIEYEHALQVLGIEIVSGSITKENE